MKNGSVGEIVDHNIMINQVSGNELDGSITNLYLRIHQGKEISFTSLIGPNSPSKLTVGAKSATWHGVFNGVSYQVSLRLGEDAWFWHVTTASSQPKIIDITYIQDIGLGTKEFVTSNEAYSSQYLDQHVEKRGEHIVVSSRQNQDQEGRHPYLQQGSFTLLDSFDTDSYQFFGTNYRKSYVPQDIKNTHLHNQKMQYESSIVAFRSVINSTPSEAVFYGAFVNDQPNPNDEILCDEISLRKMDKQFIGGDERSVNLVNLQKTIGTPVSGISLSEDQIAKLFPKRLEEERQNNELLSFFTPNTNHVVLQKKELLQQRSTGNIVMAGKTIKPTTPVLSATQFMTGVFESHLVFGNTNMNIFTTHTRDALNIFKVQGTRIYLLGRDQKYHLLALPSVFEMATNGGEWRYQFDNDTLIISDDANSDLQQMTLRFKSLLGKKYSLIVATQWNRETLGQQPVISSNQVIAKPADSTLMHERSPQTVYQINYQHQDGKLVLGDERLLFGELPENRTDQIIAQFTDTSNFTMCTGLSGINLSNQSAQKAREDHYQYTESILHHVKLNTSVLDKKEIVEQTNLILRWFTHDALVHLLSPHGLEQYGGAAWGTRDVAQGPTELFSALGHFREVREIIITLYSHQFLENGNWPQWFMYDEYADMFANESHGDVIVWPLKVLVDYLNNTGDTDILYEKLPYMSRDKKQFSKKTYSILEHVKRELDYIKSNFLPGTFVSAYGDGDWDDTLQPADPAQKQTMASTWTEELTIETLRHAITAFSSIPKLQVEVEALSNLMLGDFKTYFMKDDVLPGFVKIDKRHQVTQIIHPNDGITGIEYRLLPLSQGVLSGILKGETAENALRLIRDHLLFPDGVRLMDRPSVYHGGVSKIFKRAEQAANFGREIGLLYVHAHIRYADAVSKYGNPQKAWSLLQLVNPIQLKKRVSNAALRQANTYFSSSDADFKDRYEAQAHFDKVRSQEVQVKGGWRLYSSGPGIYIGTLLTSIFKFKSSETFNLTNGHYLLDFDPDIEISLKNFKKIKPLVLKKGKSIKKSSCKRLQ